MKAKILRNTQRPSEGEIPLHSALSIGETLQPFVARFGGATVYFLVIFLIGTIGYRSIEGWGWFDSFYMAVTTVTSVGFMEVHPLSDAGRGFTTIIIALGVTGLGIWWALITALIVELDLGGALRRRRKMKGIESLRDHYIVCGAGRVGRVVTREMLQSGRTLLAIESDEHRARELEEEYPELLVLCADATKERVLTEAHAQTAKGLIACLADDADNILVCLTVRDLNPDLAIVARAYDEESIHKLRRAGADHVISPTITGGIRMAASLIRPRVVSFLDNAIIGPDMELRLEEALIPEGSPLDGCSLADVGIPERTGLVVLALQRSRSGEDPVYNPGPETRLSSGDVMIVLGREDQVHQLREYAGGR